MKSLTTQLLLFLRQRPSRRNIYVLVKFLAVLAGMIVAYSTAFHYLMAYEEQLGFDNREHSWVTAFYWTLTVMSTLGFGDITFESDLGRIFSILVLLSGTLFLLVLLPFTFIQFFYAPWMEAQAQARTPRRLPNDTRDHVVLTHGDAITFDLIRRFQTFGQPYVLLVPDADEARELHDRGIKSMIAELDLPATFERCRLDHAAVLVTTNDDVTDANVLFLAKDAAPKVPLLSTADGESAALIHRLAGATHVLRLPQLMGESLARRTIGGDAISHAVGEIGELLVAEANASRTPMVGKTLRDNRVRDLGPSVLGIWDRGKFEPASADSIVGENAVLLLAGTRDQLDAYDEAFVIYNVSEEPVVLIGAGRVGKATAAALRRRGIDSRIIELTGRDGLDDIPEDQVVVHGDAADPDVLRKAGIATAPAVLITTGSDPTNIYLTLQIRHLRPDIQIVARAERDRSVDVLHRAGADAVMSMASVGSSRILKFINQADIVPVAEGLNVSRAAAPPSIIGKSIGELTLRADLGVTLVGVSNGNQMRVNPSPDLVIPPDAQILFLGTEASERQFFETYGRA
jgi:Trk K+ transport system NAD-binding subunit